MENTIKTASILKKELKEYEQEITNAYKNLGNKLFTDASNPIAEKTIIANDELINWQKLRDERDIYSENILNIKKNSERLNELKTFEKEVNSSNKSTIKQIDKLKTDFLKALYKDFAPNCPTLFAPVISEIHQIESEIDALNENITKLENDKAEANIFSKLSFNTKILAAKRKCAKHENKIIDLLSKNITDFQDSDEIKNLYSFEAFTDDMKKQFEELSKLYNSMSDSKKRLNMLEEEKEFVSKSLTELGVENNSNKKLNELNAQIKTSDTEIEKILQETGFKFVNEYYDEEGNSLTGKDFSDEELKDYAEALRRISFYRKKISKANYNLQYCEVSQAIQQENTKIANAERNIQSSKKAIADAEERIANAEKVKKNAQDALVTLQVQADNLKEKFAGTDNSEINNSKESPAEQTEETQEEGEK